MDQGLLLRVLKGLATRNYEACAEAVPPAFGLCRSSVSRRYVKGTARKLAEFQQRSLEGYDLVALFLDGKSFADEEILIALGVTLEGQKVPLGFVQAATENERVCRRFLAELVERGLQYEAGLLVVIDGGKGLYKAVRSVLQGHACVQRCQYHKRQNVVSYLPKSEQAGVRRKLEAAYGPSTYEEARAALEALKPGLQLMNQSALRSLEEGQQETLTLHRLGLMPMLYRERQQSPGAVDAQRAALDELVAASRRTPRQSNPSGGSSVEPFLLYVPPGGWGNIRDGEWQAGTTPRDVEEGHLHICVFCVVVSGCSACSRCHTETCAYCVHSIIIRVVVMACVCNTLTSVAYAESSNEADPALVFWIDESPQISASKEEGY